MTAETASLAQHLDRDLQRIASSANEKLRAIADAGLVEPFRQAEEARVINVARAFAVLRVESTVRHLRKEPLGFQPEPLSLGAVPDRRTRDAISAQERTADVPRVPDQAHASGPVEATETPSPPAELDRVGVGAAEDVQEPEVITPDTPYAAVRPEPVVIESVSEVVVPHRPRESDEHRLRRLVRYVARQEPGLKWAVGQREDGTAVLVTDLAHGWIPSGIDLPAGVQLLAPARRNGNAVALLGQTELTATYTPGDSFTEATQFDVTSASDTARRTEPVDDLGWQLAEATHWRDGLPRMAHTMAKAGAAGTGVVEAELDVLRVHLDTVRYQLLARYPDVEPSVVLNCMLLAATEAIACADQTAANYHFAWFVALSAPPASSWSAQA
ncbi:MAG: DUF5631 domain-containing protein [Mycobacterium sp.]